ncbi:MAG: nicotinate-nucleotide--dimethylbenzimidazole phosphoribosyltransferase [Candidatus Omnitrophica bacterium]|nr:nicotinate-nucleotide--dimethylbenzimidazole phosphoribosyltransferase [Candidatus Omnitrophota bacterium]
MQNWTDRFKTITSLDPEWKIRAQRHLNDQTRPQGSLGVIEEMITRLAAIQKTDRPEIESKRILIFAADHGVEAEGVSLYPREVTQAMVLNFLNGGATVNALARHAKAEVQVIDVGVDGEDFKKHDRLVSAKIRRSTRNMVDEPAMTQEELSRALAVGWDLIHQLKEEGVQLIGLGEMGIGNTTAASAVIAALTDFPVDSVTGCGTGLSVEARHRKVYVIEKAIEKHRALLTNPLAILQRLGGYELAALTGAILASAHLSLPVIIDGWIVSASAFVAISLNENIKDYLFFAHQSEERGHALILEKLEVHPMLNLKMRLGEASGAALAMNLFDAAVKIYHEVSTFEDARVANVKS